MPLPQAFLAIEKTMIAALQPAWRRRLPGFIDDLTTLVESMNWKNMGNSEHVTLQILAKKGTKAIPVEVHSGNDMSEREILSQRGAMMRNKSLRPHRLKNTTIVTVEVV